MARDERRLLEEIAMDIARSQYDFNGSLEELMKASETIKKLSNKALVEYITK